MEGNSGVWIWPICVMIFMAIQLTFCDNKTNVHYDANDAYYDSIRGR